MAFDVNRRTYRFDQALGNQRRLLRVTHGRQDDSELVAADTRQRIAIAQRGAQPFGNRTQQLVADLVAKRIVYVLEIVEIQTEHGGLSAALRIMPQRLA